MKNNEATIFVFIASIIIGILISLNINFKEINTKLFLTPSQYQEAYDNVNKLNRDISALRSKYNDEKAKLQKYVKGQNDKSEVTKEMEKELLHNKMLLGNVDIKGPGVVIEMQDANISTIENAQDPVEQKAAIIHDSDVINLINEIKYSGAEAISINDETINAKTDMFCWGPFIEVDKVKVFAPFKIKAIGDREAIYSYLTSDVGYLTFLRLRGIKIKISKEDNINILSKKKVDEHKYAQEIKDK